MAPGLDKVTILSNSADGSGALGAIENKGDASGLKRRKKKALPAYLQPEELERFWRVIISVRDRAIFRVAYHAGLRASEVGLLELRDYDGRTDRVYVHRLKGS